MINPKNRIKWDMLMFFIIIISTFEIPYSILVGYEDLRIQNFFNYFFSIAFLSDMILNCFTIHEKRYSGFWGWRNITGLFSYKLSTDYLKDKDSYSIVINKQPQIFISYITSGWFLIDFLAIFPFEIIFSQLVFLSMSRTLRLARITRMLRLLRTIRVVKTIRLYKYFNNIFSHHPALGRFTIISLLVPWFAHILACFLYYFESSSKNNLINSYSDALHFMFITFTTNNLASTLSTAGYIISIMSVIVSFLFIGIFIGNFSSLFEKIDEQKAIFEQKKKEWNIIFKEFPEIYDKKTRHKVLQHILDSETDNSTNFIEKHYNLLRTLDSSLECKIKERINSCLNKKDENIESLKKFIDIKEKKYTDQIAN